MSKTYDRRFVVQRSHTFPRVWNTYNKIPNECNEELYACSKWLTNWLACSQTANENSYGWIRHQEKPGRMISMDSIGHSICPNYRKPMKILFYLRVSYSYEYVARYRILPVTPTSSLRPPFGEPLGYCQSYCNIIVVVNRSLPLFSFSLYSQRLYIF